MKRRDGVWYRVKDLFGSFVHNCVAHPAMFFLPAKIGQRFHDWSARLWDRLGEYDDF